MWLFVVKECLLVKKKSFAGNLEDSLLVCEGENTVENHWLLLLNWSYSVWEM